jgi:hypothetical protein
MISFIVTCSITAVWAVIGTISFIHSLDLYPIYVESGPGNKLVMSQMAFWIELTVSIGSAVLVGAMVLLVQSKLDGLIKE